MPDVSFEFGGRKWQARRVEATKPGQTTYVVFGLGLNPKLDRLHVLYRSSETVAAADGGDWWSPKSARLSPLARAALAAVGT